MPRAQVAPNRGRPKKDGPLASRRKDVFFEPDEWAQVETHLDEHANTIGAKIRPGTFIHDITMRVVRGEPVGPDPSTLDTALAQSRLRFLTRAPASPYQDAIEHAGDFVLSRAVADYYDVGDQDVIVGVQGESLEPAIPDGALLIMRPVTAHRQPVRGEVVLVQMWDAEGNYKSTLKRFSGMDGATPRLVDGSGVDFEAMPGAVGFACVAVAKGIMARL